MDIKQNNGGHQYNFNLKNVKQSPPQKVTLRRRCRSECLQMSPIPPLQNGVEQQQQSAKTRTNKSHHYLRSKAESPSFLVESFSLHTNRKLLPVTNELPNINNPNSNHNNLLKENVMLNGYQNQNNRPEITDMKDVYMKDMELYKKSRKSELVVKQNSHNLNNRHVEGSAVTFNPRNTIFDSNSRKMRARSESEPHEIYTTTPLLSSSATGSSKTPTRTWINGRDRQRKEQLISGRDISLKRTRETISPVEENLPARPSPSRTTKESPPSKMLTAERTKNLPRLKSTKATTIVNGYRCNKTLRSRTATPVNKFKPSTILRSSIGRKSVSPTNDYGICTSPTPSAASGTTNTESINTQDLENDENSDAGDDGADVECVGEDDDLDEEVGDDEEVLDDSMTDSEDNYKTHLAALHSKSSMPTSPSSSRVAPTIGSVVGGCVEQGPLAPSLFPHVPPYITFSTHEDKGSPMPPAIQKCLKWKLTLITPIIVRKVLINSGFRLLKKTNDWMGIWGKHMKSACFKTLKPYQKFNHLPGSFQIGRKDRLWRNLQTQMSKYGKKEFGFMPKTYIIPQDLKILRQMWTKYSQRNCKWIIKPPASARGTGIKVVNRWAQIPKRKPLIVQRYIDRPLLINGSKFDLRLYVLVTSTNPLRVFLHTDGLARFASVKYSEKSDTLNDRYMHLTNYSINKLSTHYSQNEDANACKGHKWTIKSLWEHFRNQGIDVDRLWAALRNLVLRTILAGEAPINAMSKINVGSKYNCYELFGIDVLLDSELVPWLLEVNISPSLHSSSSLDAHVKGPLVRALFNTALYQIPPRIPLVEQKEILKEYGLKGPLCYDKRLYVTGLTKAERMKHNQFIQRDMPRDEYINDILDDLTPDDVRCLLISEDELSRSAPLERILPAPNSHKYLGFTENPRYYNRLLDAWESKYSQNRDEGIELLKDYCDKKLHLEVPPTTVKKDCNDKMMESTNVEPESTVPSSQTTITTTVEENVSDDAGNDEQNSDPNAMELDKFPLKEFDEIKLLNQNGLITSTLINDAILMKQQECGDTENAIIVQD